MTLQSSIGTPEALFEKLERTFHRRVAYGDDQLDWVFDFCVSAWHLIDWVAQSRFPNDRRALKNLQDEYRSRCSQLALCERVCNGSKHLVLDNPKLAGFDIATQVFDSGGIAGYGIAVATAGPLTGAQLAEMATAPPFVCTPSIVIADGKGEEWGAIGLFIQVLGFWRTELGLLSMS